MLKISFIYRNTIKILEIREKKLLKAKLTLIARQKKPEKDKKNSNNYHDSKEYFVEKKGNKS